MILLTVMVVGDIVYYTDLGTSFPPFAGAAIAAMISSPFLLIPLLLYCIAAKLHDRHSPPENSIERDGYKPHLIRMRVSFAVMVFVLFMVVLGTFVSVQMGLHSVFFILLRVQYLCQAYSVVFIIALIVFIRSRMDVKNRK